MRCSAPNGSPGRRARPKRHSRPTGPARAGAARRRRARRAGAPPGRAGEVVEGSLRELRGEQRRSVQLGSESAFGAATAAASSRSPLSSRARTTATSASDTACATSASARSASAAVVDPAATVTARTSAANDRPPNRRSPLESSKLVTVRKYSGRTTRTTSRRQPRLRGERLSQIMPPHIGHAGSTRRTTAP